MMGSRVSVKVAPALVLLMAVMGAACHHAASSDSDSAVSPTDAANDITARAIARADSVYALMTPEERVGQVFMPSIYAQADTPTLGRLEEWYTDYAIGGIILLKGDLTGSRTLSEALDSLSTCGVGPWIAIDAEWGLGMRLADAPKYTPNGRLPADTDEGEMYDYGYEIASQCREAGINMVLGPVLDVCDPTAGGVIGVRSFGADPARVADLGCAYARGLEDGGVVSVAKHFPGHGVTRTDTHRGLGMIDRSLHEMDSVDLVPFRRYIDSGLTAVMAGHLAVPALDSRPLPAAVSAAVLKDLLCDELGFRGLVLTDALNMEGAEGHTALDALRAGADMVLAPADIQMDYDEVLNAVKSSPADSTLLADRVRRILFFKVLGVRR